MVILDRWLIKAFLLNRVEIAMLFSNVDFSKLELRQRRKLKEELFHQLRSLLSNGFSLTDIHNVWFDQVQSGEGSVHTKGLMNIFCHHCLYDLDFDIHSIFSF